MLSRHQCLIYDGAPSRQLDSFAQTIANKLMSNHRCLYLNSPPMVTGLRSYLSAAGLDVSEQIEKGALILSSSQEHLVDGMFDVARMLGSLKDMLVKALADGYAGLWASGDMTWEFGNEKNLDKVLEYERGLEEFMQDNPALSGVCQYHRDTLPREAIAAALETHQAVYINQTLSQLNPHYRCVAS